MKILIRWYKKWKRARNIKQLKNIIPPYLQKTFVEELNYKLWVTKGARFNASNRCKKLAQLSNRTIGYLSAYLIIINMINVYEIPFYTKLPDNYLAFGTTALSILILVFSQFESSKNYQIAAEKYHLCALEISVLYDQLRYLKSDVAGITQSQISSITDKYENLLRRHENHDPIDFRKFTTTKPKYFELSKIDCYTIRFIYWINTSMKYHLFIYLPIFIFIAFQMLK